MIMHIVLLQPKSEATPEEIQTVLDRAKALQHKIPGIIEVQAGENRNSNNYGYTYGMVMRFTNEAHLQAYFPHPEHRAVGAELRRLCSSLMNFDLPQEG
jgi:heme-degrading monooxygenase HmoA